MAQSSDGASDDRPLRDDPAFGRCLPCPAVLPSGDLAFRLGDRFACAGDIDGARPQVWSATR